MQLTSTPNTLQTELGLAGAATVQRTIGNTDPQALICCSQYGQEYRHSDPHIGQGVNQAVSAGPRQRLDTQRGKRRTIVAVAVARELTGFCWALANAD